MKQETVIATIVWAVTVGLAVWSISSSREAPASVVVEKKKLTFSGFSPYVRCRELRAEFFKNCMAYRGDDEGLAGMNRTTCEVYWAQLDGHVFDGDPRNNLTEEKDCSSEF